MEDMAVIMQYEQVQHLEIGCCTECVYIGHMTQLQSLYIRNLNAGAIHYILNTPCASLKHLKMDIDRELVEWTIPMTNRCGITHLHLCAIAAMDKTLVEYLLQCFPKLPAENICLAL
jgi:hypothetical protein